MLFRKVFIVEYQQIAPIIDRRGAVSGHDGSAHPFPVAVGIRFHHGDRSASPTGGPHQPERLRLRQHARCNAQLGRRLVDRESAVFAVGHQVLQLHRPALGNPRRNERIPQRSLRREQSVRHENLPDDRIDERRMHAVSAEITRPREPIAKLPDPGRQVRQPNIPPSQRHLRLFNIPAIRPVEKAI